MEGERRRQGGREGGEDSVRGKTAAPPPTPAPHEPPSLPHTRVPPPARRHPTKRGRRSIDSRTCSILGKQVDYPECLRAGGASVLAQSLTSCLSLVM